MFNAGMMPTINAKNSGFDSCLPCLLNRKTLTSVDEEGEVCSNTACSEIRRKGTASKTCTFTIFI